MTAYSPAAGAGFAPHPAGSSSAALADKLLNTVLFVTVALSAIVFIEPSPHDGLMFVLLIAAAAARVPFDRKLVPLFILVLIWLLGGGLSVLQVADDDKAVQYFGTSVYLGLAAILFACLVSDGNLVRLLVLRRAYLLAAVVATLAGYIGYFHLLPGSDVLLSDGRIRATFKDPNVYGPFLIYPLLLLIADMLADRIRLLGAITALFLAGGLLLAFSRGAWVHFSLSAVVAVLILIAAAPTQKKRARIIFFTIAAIVLMCLFVAALMSVDSIHAMFVERAKVLQPYDVAGSGGRFSLQELALSQILDNPNGMGPFAFSDMFGGQQHNVYMQGFLVYGWLGGGAYLALVAVTLFVGLSAVFQRTPWQPYLIVAYATFVGEAGEGIIIDSDHWRHFFLVLGLVWGLSAANINYRRQSARATAPPHAF
jgi:hypothetical protein